MKNRRPELLVFVLLAIPLFANAATEGNYTYTTNTAGQATIEKFDQDYSGSIIIPDTLGDCPVTTIEARAFENCTNLTGVTIGNSVTTIEWNAFSKCRNLAHLTIGNSVITIGASAFDYCDSLTHVTIPNSVTNIGDYAFSACSSLVSITLPNRITAIGYNFFYSCSSLISVTIPDSVTVIKKNAFRYCASLQRIYFAGNAPLIEGNTFSSDIDTTLYYLPETSGWETTYDDRPTTVLWNPTFSAINRNADGFACTVTGTTDIPIALEACSDLLSNSWITVLSTNLTEGILNIHTADATNYPTHFYRIVGP